MKKLLPYLFILLAFILGVLFKQKKNSLPKTEITFLSEVYDFKNIPKNKEVKALFNFENTGETPITINYIDTRCGCSVANWNERQIMPGQTDSIKVFYDAEAIGYFSKEIFITYNKKNHRKLYITGTVIKND